VARAYDYEGVTVTSTLTYSYDALLRTTGLTESVTASQAGATVNLDAGLLNGFTQTLSYDFWDNIVGSAISISTVGGGVGNLSQTYGYDTWDRLVAYSVGSGSTLAPLGADGAAIASQTFQYDLLDNLTQTVETPQSGGAFTAEYAYSAASPFLLTSLTPRPGQTVSPYRYDALQRATTDSHGTQIAYDPLGRVASMTLAGGETIGYTYGPGGEAITQSASDGSALYTYYEGGSPVARVDATGAAQARTLFGFASAAALPMTTHDLLGNPVLVRNLAIQPATKLPPPMRPIAGSLGNQVLAENLFTATGVQTNLAASHPQAGYPQNLQPATGSPLTAAALADGGLGYNEAITDPFTGYQLLGGYRGYDPTVGRFHRPDGASPGAGLNPYAYTGNQFVGASDPTGHYTYTYNSYNVAIKAIEQYAARHSGHGFWGQVVSNYTHVVTNMFKHPGNVNTWVAAATTAANATGPLWAAASDQLRKLGPAGEVFSGVYDGIQSFVMGTMSLGFASYNPQTGTGAFQSAGVGNMLGSLTLGYLNMAPNGMPEVHAGHSFGTHMERWGKGIGDIPENLVSDMLAVPIGLCYDMPMDFATGNYYMAGYALGYNTAALVAMIAAPEDAGAVGEAGSLTADADLTGVGDLFKEEDDDYYFGKTEEPGFGRSFGEGFKNGIKERPEAGIKTTKSLGRGLQGKFGSKAVREARAGRFRAYCGEYLGEEIAKGLVNPVTYENLNMSDPRSPWSTAAWQNMVYRQGPYKPKQK
jgi:RHS repeat-associated protein